MICFEIHLNDDHLCTAGVGDDGVLTAIATATRQNRERSSETPSRNVSLHVGGISAGRDLSWIDAFGRLDAGDVVTVRIVEHDAPDPPRRIDLIDTGQGRERQLGPEQVGQQCSFCAKFEAEVRVLVPGPKANVCNECVSLIVDLMRKKGVDPAPGGTA